MKIAASSCSWWHHTLEEGVKLASAAGFTAYEPLMFPEEIAVLHGDVRKMSAGQLTRLLGDHGMTLAAMHTVAIVTGDGRAWHPRSKPPHMGSSIAAERMGILLPVL